MSKSRTVAAVCAAALLLTTHFGCARSTRHGLVVTVPRGWSSEIRTVIVGTPEGHVPRDITYYRNSIGMEFVLLPGGEFVMGSEKGAPDEQPIQRLRIPKALFVSAFEVTQAQYMELIGKDPSNFKSARNPVESVTWKDAGSFCQALAVKEGLKYRLPTEAEWEYACRAGGKTAFYWGNTMRNDCAWWSGNSGAGTHPVGQKLPNGFGLYDMSGNVCEWCRTVYRKYPYSEMDDMAHYDPAREHVTRGGSWRSDSTAARSATRARVSARAALIDTGFRVVVPAEE